MPKKPFIKERKQEFEALLMYYWLHDIVPDNDDYWHEYILRVSLSIKLVKNFYNKAKNGKNEIV